VFKKEFHTLGSISLTAFPAIYRVVEMTGKDSTTSYTDLLFISFYSITEFLECKINKDNIYSTKLLL